MKKLFIDDERMPADVNWVDIGTGPWNIVRSCNEAITWVLEHGFPDVISFDHDLGYEQFDTTESGLIVVIDAQEAASGYDFAKWLIEYDLDNQAMPAHFSFTVHSMNPVGAENIRSLLSNYIRSK